jgi:hypothetical protein
MKPYLLLSERKRYRYPGWTRADQTLLHSLLFNPAAQIFLKEPALGFRK